MPEILVSLPAACVSEGVVERMRACHVDSDPPGRQLGSGGGTAWLLYRAWLAQKKRPSFGDWLCAGQKAIIHASGESRRLPGYAVAGKANLPLPLAPGRPGQLVDQTLLDLQIEMAERVLRHAPADYVLLIACGDVLLEWDNWLPVIGRPAADVLIAGLTASPEEISRHGALVSPAGAPSELEYLLQKPPVEKLRELDGSHVCVLDTGVWLMTARAVECLMRCCGWDFSDARFGARDVPLRYDLFSDFGSALGRAPTAQHPEISRLETAIMALPNGRFFHFGTPRSMLAATHRLLCPFNMRRSFDAVDMDSQAEPVVLNSHVDADVLKRARFVWIENACIPATWQLCERHIVTGVPRNNWSITLPAGVCIDMVPVSETEWCLRPYGFDDCFRGPAGFAGTQWMQQPLTEWFALRGMALEKIVGHPEKDIHETALFPVVAPDADAGRLLQWMTASQTTDDDAAAMAGTWQAMRRLSARDLLREGRSDILLERRRENLRQNLRRTGAEQWRRMLFSADLQRLAADLTQDIKPPEGNVKDLSRVHVCMLKAATMPHEKAVHEAEAVEHLRGLLTLPMQHSAVEPRSCMIEDQIVWGRSPVRLDLAGGWTDTPPYCLEYGGCVVNVAADLNGQPPIQVFGRIGRQPGIVLRSIDLGIDRRITTYDELDSAPRIGSGFGIAAAALQLAGMHPRYYKGRCAATLIEHMRRTIGGGIELSMLAAVPKGSGLGASSILAATILAVLGDMLDLKWSKEDIFSRTLALEQILASGGGWQDQAGGMYPGIKMVSTLPGINQKHELRWLPGDLFGAAYANRRILLYYTGITRTAHDILGQIVKGFFRNETRRIRIIEDIAANAGMVADALQRNDWETLCEGLCRSWNLNRQLDAGTNPPGVREIIRLLGDDVSALKLLGAGGGGFMLIFAHDEACAQTIRGRLTDRPPNPRARFVELGLSATGLQVTRS